MKQELSTLRCGQCELRTFTVIDVNSYIIAVLQMMSNLNKNFLNIVSNMFILLRVHWDTGTLRRLPADYLAKDGAV